MGKVPPSPDGNAGIRAEDRGGKGALLLRGDGRPLPSIQSSRFIEIRQSPLAVHRRQSATGEEGWCWGRSQGWTRVGRLSRCPRLCTLGSPPGGGGGGGGRHWGHRELCSQHSTALRSAQLKLSGGEDLGNGPRHQSYSVAPRWVVVCSMLLHEVLRQLDLLL